MIRKIVSRLVLAVVLIAVLLTGFVPEASAQSAYRMEIGQIWANGGTVLWYGAPVGMNYYRCTLHIIDKQLGYGSDVVTYDHTASGLNPMVFKFNFDWGNKYWEIVGNRYVVLTSGCDAWDNIGSYTVMLEYTLLVDARLKFYLPMVIKR